MRKIALETDTIQIGILWVLSLLYFLFANELRTYPYPPIFLFLVFVFQFTLSIFFFYVISKIFQKDITLKPFIFTFTYTLIPTLIWFGVNSILFAILPPPRTMSMLGKTFSIVYIAFSLSVLVWKVILWYLSIRFSSRLAFYRIFYLMLLYAAVFAPYTILLYSFKIFRIPFI